MKKIPTIFERDPKNMKRVLGVPVEECQWVFDGEGVATEKYDGSACLVRLGTLYRRHRLKADAPVPVGWIHWDFEDPKPSGHGWLPVREGPEDNWHREAWEAGSITGDSSPPWPKDGTYELVGPKLQKNPYKFNCHWLLTHGYQALPSFPRTFTGIPVWFQDSEPMEGVVWHHSDGRMAKIKARDFGLKWPR